ncbi:hypothetical protein CDAR_410931 [Caerostris darwini]|uniref:Uncharacterized protein n=1 Tax=Caerostris darwini TaxID=1538125 RepID=A0AAV4SCU3_9ARAC|nr:hypothetical protein CDAR_410931 [Caerostris darwini]
MRSRIFRSKKHSVLEAFRCQQVDEGSVEAAPGPHQRRDRQPQGPAAPTFLHTTATLPAAAHGARLRLRAEGQLLSAR